MLRDIHFWGAHALRVPFAAPRRETSQWYPAFSASHCSRRLAMAPIASRRGDRPPRNLLAQFLRLSQARRPMNSSGRSQTCVRVLIAAVLFAAFSWTLLVSVSPQLHGYIHDDANRTDHVCAITLIASGSYEQASQPPLISAPQFDVCFPATASLTPVWVKPLFLSAHIFAHGPPAHS